MRRALGKGLSQLLSEQIDEATEPTTLPVKAIQANQRQPRTSFDEETLGELAASIKEFGILQPLIVRPIAEGKYELIAGERRLRASKLAGLKEVPVVIRSASAQDSLEIALIENVQREDISAIECAAAYRKLIEEFGLKQEAVAQRVGKSRVAVANTLRLLHLPEEVQDAIQEGLVSEGHARAILMVSSPNRQIQLFDKVIGEGLTVRQAEQAARGMESAQPGKGGGRKAKKRASNDPNTEAIEQGLSEHFGTPVKISQSGDSGEIAIPYYSDEDLQRILDVLGFSL